MFLKVKINVIPFLLHLFCTRKFFTFPYNDKSQTKGHKIIGVNVFTLIFYINFTFI